MRSGGTADNGETHGKHQLLGGSRELSIEVNNKHDSGIYVVLNGCRYAVYLLSL